VSAFRSTAAAHDGTYGLVMGNGSGWLYRTPTSGQVAAGDTLSVWLKFSGSANGRAYFGFGANSGGTLSLVAAPNTGQLIIQNNVGFGFTDLAAVSQTYQANHWYRLEVDWGTSGTIIGKLFDGNGTTLLKTVTASTTAFTAGGIAFRATGNNKYFDTVTDTNGVNNFAVSVSTPGEAGGQASTADLFGPGVPADVLSAGAPGGIASRAVGGELSAAPPVLASLAVSISTPAGPGAQTALAGLASSGGRLNGLEAALALAQAPVVAVGIGTPAVTSFEAPAVAPSNREGLAETQQTTAPAATLLHGGTGEASPDGADDWTLFDTTDPGA
jgi:hypothetical protein